MFKIIKFILYLLLETTKKSNDITELKKMGLFVLFAMQLGMY